MRVALESSEPTPQPSTTQVPPSSSTSQPTGEATSVQSFHEALSKHGSSTAHGSSQPHGHGSAKHAARSAAKGPNDNTRADTTPLVAPPITSTAPPPIVPVHPGTAAPSSASTSPSAAPTTAAHHDVIAPRGAVAPDASWALTPTGSRGGRTKSGGASPGPGDVVGSLRSHVTAARAMGPETAGTPARKSTGAAALSPATSSPTAAGSRSSVTPGVTPVAVDPDTARQRVTVLDASGPQRVRGGSVGDPVTSARVPAGTHASVESPGRTPSGRVLEELSVPNEPRPSSPRDAGNPRAGAQEAGATAIPGGPTRDSRSARAPAPVLAGVSLAPTPAQVITGVGDAAVASAAPPHAMDVAALAGAISRPLMDSHGFYSVSVAMQPEDLGQLQAVVTLRGNDLLVSITAHTHSGHEALSGALNALKGELSRGGMNVNVTLRDPSSAPHEHHQPQRRAPRAEALVEAGPSVSPMVHPGHAGGQIHLVL